MHHLVNPVQKRLATLEADSAPVANPEPRLDSLASSSYFRLIVASIIFNALEFYGNAAVAIGLIGKD